MPIGTPPAATDRTHSHSTFVELTCGVAANTSIEDGVAGDRGLVEGLAQAE
jgi:hypothetical protein